MKHSLYPSDPIEQEKQTKELHAKYKADIYAASILFEKMVMDEILKGSKGHPISLFTLAGAAFQMGYNARILEEKENKS